MEETALVISIVSLLMALVLAGFGTLLQWLISKDTRQQATEIRNDVGDFKAEVGSLLGEIRGLTTQTRESQERQMDTMIHALAGHATEVVSTGTVEVESKIDAVEAALTEPERVEVSEELDSLRQIVRELREAVGRSVQPPIWHAGSERVFSDLGKNGGLRLMLNREELATGGTFRIHVVAEGASVGPVHISCGVSTPSGRMFSKKVPALRSPGRGDAFAAFEYPFDYPDADTSEPGEYIVTGQLWGGLAGMNLVQRKDITFRVLPL